MAAESIKDELDKALSDLHQAEELQKKMKDANRILRSGRNVVARLQSELGYSEDQAQKVVNPDFAGRKGYPQYKLTNNLANIKRLQDRVLALKKKVEASAAPEQEKYEFAGGRIEVNYDLDRVQVFFDAIPDKEIRSNFKKEGWNWSPSNTAWQRKITPQAIISAKRITGATGEAPASLAAPLDLDKGKKFSIEDIEKRNFSYVSLSAYDYSSQLPDPSKSSVLTSVFVVLDGHPKVANATAMEFIKRALPGIDESKVKLSAYGRTYVREAKALYKEGKFIPGGDPEVVLRPFYQAMQGILKASALQANELTSLKDLEAEYEGKTADELVAIKKKLYPSPDIASPMSDEEKLLERIISKKFSELNQKVLERRAATQQEIIDKLEFPPKSSKETSEMTEAQTIAAKLIEKIGLPTMGLPFDSNKGHTMEIKYNEGSSVVTVIIDDKKSPVVPGIFIKATGFSSQSLSLQKTEEAAQKVTWIFEELKKRTEPVPKEENKVDGAFMGIDHQYPNQYVLNKAIEALIASRGEDHQNYSAEEKIFLSKYSGYGGLSEFGEAGKGAFFEYYTPKPIIEKMWALAYKYGYNNGPVLEPSCATGEFFQFAKPDIRKVGYEISEWSAKICRILYPTAEIHVQPFEQAFIKNNFTVKDKTEGLEKFDLAIGNPPYGDFSIVQSRYMAMGEKDHVSPNNYVEYFLRRSVDLLNPGGILVFIVGAAIQGGGRMFLDSGPSTVKTYLAETTDFLEAYRLPDTVFERTGVTSDIIVLRKK